METKRFIHNSMLVYITYIRRCSARSFKASWGAANNVVGAVLVTMAMILYGSIHFMGGDSLTAQAVNAGASIAIYTACALVIIFIFRTIFMAPYQLWLDGGYRPGKSAAEIMAIVDMLGKAHAEAITLVADTLPDSDFHRNRRTAWTMDTMRMMEQLEMPDHEIFCFQNPTGLPDQEKCLRERQQLLRSLIEQYMREKQCRAGK
jgi:hypothetical protein